MSTIVIKKGREKPIIQQHPWIFSGAIERVEENPKPGDIVTVISHDNRFLARGYWNPKSQIQVRILTWQDEEIDEDWWRRMLKRAIAVRLEKYVSNDHNVPCRLVNAENDYIPGLVVDLYSYVPQEIGNDIEIHWLVVQALTLGIDVRKKMLAKLLHEIVSEYRGISIEGIYERSDVDVRGKEGLSQHKGVLLGEVEPPDLLFNRTSFVHPHIDIKNGHKTGTYLDQQTNHEILANLVRNYDSEKCRVLNLFSYTGTFGLWAFAHGGSEVTVTNVDASHDALEIALQSVNEDDKERVECIQADVFEYLRDMAKQGEEYDVVILDPPKFAHNAQQVEKAARGYKDINLNAFKLVKPGGYLMTFSCSGAISRDLFQKIVFGALADSGRQAQIVKHLSASDDHPVALTFPEGEYLKGLLLRVY